MKVIAPMEHPHPITWTAFTVEAVMKTELFLKSMSQLLYFVFCGILTIKIFVLTIPMPSSAVIQ